MKARTVLVLGVVLCSFGLSCSLAQAGGVRIGVGIGLPIGIGIGGPAYPPPYYYRPYYGYPYPYYAPAPYYVAGPRVWTTGGAADILLSCAGATVLPTTGGATAVLRGSARINGARLRRKRPFHKHSAPAGQPAGRHRSESSCPIRGRHQLATRNLTCTHNSQRSTAVKSARTDKCSLRPLVES